MNLSEHFTLEELTHTEHRELENIPNEIELANLKRLAEFIERVKTVLGVSQSWLTARSAVKRLMTR